MGCMACGSAIPLLPAQGGPAWTELTSEHFTLWTDAPATRGHALIQQLERERQVITRAMNHATARARSFVVALRNDREVGVYLPDRNPAAAWDGGADLQPGMLFAANTPDRDRAVTHEVAHLVSFSFIPHQPSWLAEGIASYFEMAELDPFASVVEVGRPRSDHGDYLRSSPPVPLAELFTCHEHACADAPFYATSWAVVSLLVNEHGDQLSRYLQHLTELPADSEPPVEGEPFPDLPTATLDRELAEWLRSGGIRLPRIAVTVRDMPVTERTLRDADVLAVRALLDLHYHPDAAPRSSDAALAADRTNLLAWLVEVHLGLPITADEARAVAAAHPDNWRAWWLLWRAVQHGDEAITARDQMCAGADVELAVCAARASR